MANEMKYVVAGIIDAINSKEDKRNKQKQFKKDLMLEEMKRRRKSEYEQKERERESEYMDPIQQMFARRYFSENPDEISQFSGIPGVGMEAQKAQSDIVKKGTGAAKATSQPGVTAPSTYTPPSPRSKTVKATAKGGFEKMSVKEQVQQQMLDKYMAGTASDAEKDLLGITKEEKFVDSMRKVEAGEMDIKALEKKYPEKGKEIKEYKIGKMDFKTKNVMAQIKGIVKESPDNMESVINDLLSRKHSAISKGIDVDAIVDVLGINEKDWNDNRQKAMDDLLSGGVWEIEF